MTDCHLTQHPTDPSLCWCEACERTLPVRLLHARRNCQKSAVPRSEEEIAALKALCWQCPNRRPEIPFWCALDQKRGSCVKTRGAAYAKRLECRGGECQPWLTYLQGVLETS